MLNCNMNKTEVYTENVYFLNPDSSNCEQRVHELIVKNERLLGAEIQISEYGHRANKIDHETNHLAWALDMRYLAVPGTFGSISSACVSAPEVNLTDQMVVIKRSKQKTAGKRHLRREATILRRLRHENIIHLHLFMEWDDSTVLFIDAADTDVNSWLCEMNQPPAESVQRLWVKQLMRAFDYLNEQRIVHRDAKTENILMWRATNRICVCDFGSAAVFTTERTYEPNYGTLQFLAPETLLKSSMFTPASDWWGLACIVFEMTTATMLFDGHNKQQQLELIIEALGYPDETTMHYMAVPDASRQKISLMRAAAGSRPSVPNVESALSEVPCVEARVVLRGLLKLNPRNRMSPVEALKLPFCAAAEVTAAAS